MSHSPNDEERTWNFGMVGTDWIGFPVCTAIEEVDTTIGRLKGSGSFWNEVNRIRWTTNTSVNYFTVAEFEKHQHNRSSTKSGAEGAETFIQWKATFCTKQQAVVSQVNHAKGKITVKPSDGRSHTWTVSSPLRIVVSEGDEVHFGQVLAAAPQPISVQDLKCCGDLSLDQISEMLSSRQRTRRFTGVKLARVRQDRELQSSIQSIAQDPDEDVYVRLEAATYLVGVCGHSADSLFGEYVDGNDEQNQLESVIAMGEARTEGAVRLLASVLHDVNRPYFLRSAAAWSLGQTQFESANEQLVAAFADVDHKLRHESLETLVGLGGRSVERLLAGLRESNSDIIAGCAEALRQQVSLPDNAISFLSTAIRGDTPNNWIVWLVGQLGATTFRTEVEKLRVESPQIYYAVQLMWTFTESWIAQQWILNPSP